MNCSCVSVDMDGCVDLISKTKPTARKGHKCHECYRAISPGEQYEVQKYRYEGKFEAHKTCSECVDIRNMFFCEGYRYGSIREDLVDDLNDADCELSESCIAELSPKARDIICEIIEECENGRINKML
jgi:hypothetical protein